MSDKEKRITVLQVVCWVGGFLLVTTLIRFLGYDSILASAIAGAAGALLGTGVYELIQAMRR